MNDGYFFLKSCYVFLLLYLQALARILLGKLRQTTSIIIALVPQLTTNELRQLALTNYKGRTKPTDAKVST